MMPSGCERIYIVETVRGDKVKKSYYSSKLSLFVKEAANGGFTATGESKENKSQEIITTKKS